MSSRRRQDERQERPGDDGPNLAGVLADIGRIAVAGLLRTANQYFGDNLVGAVVDYSQALLTIRNLLEQLKGEEEYDVTALVGQVLPLVRVQQKVRDHRLKLRPGPVTVENNDARDKKNRRKKEASVEAAVLTREEASEWEHWLNHSVAAYGYDSFKGMGIATARDLLRLKDNEQTFTWLTGIRGKHLKLWYGDHGLYLPGYYVALDHAKRSVVVAVRGSNGIHDAIVDIVCEQEDYTFAADPDKMKGKVHVGFLIAAQNTDKAIRETVQTLMTKYPKYQLIVTGHSLGAGVATILGLNYVDVLKNRTVHVYAYAPPCSLDRVLAKTRFVRQHVTSVVNDDDVVCRLGLSTLVDIRRILLEFHKHKDLTDQEKYEIYHQIELEHLDKKLFPGGNTWVVASEYHYYKPALIDQVEELCSIQVTTKMIPNHLPPSYHKVVGEVKQFV